MLFDTGIKLFSSLHFQENTKALKPLPGSRIVFFKNGESLGDAFIDIYEGEYTPAVRAMSCL